MLMKKLIIVNGAMGVEKTSLIRFLTKSYKNQFFLMGIGVGI